MNDASCTCCILYTPQGSLPVEAGKKIAGKQSFRHPNRLFPHGTFKTDTGKKDLDAVHYSKMRRENVLMFGLSVDAKPADLLIFEE